MKKISIKTIDGGRFDFMDSDLQDPIHELRAKPYGDVCWVVVPLKDCTRRFNIQNIVSITETEQEE